MGVELDQIPHKYDEYFDFLKIKLGVERSLNGRRVRSNCLLEAPLVLEVFPDINRIEHQRGRD